MLENPFYYTEEAKRQRSYWRRVVTVALAGIGLAAAVIIALYPRPARAEPIAQTTAGAVKVILHNEPCALPEVTNLPNRATWIEGGGYIRGLLRRAAGCRRGRRLLHGQDGGCNIAAGVR